MYNLTTVSQHEQYRALTEAEIETVIGGYEQSEAASIALSLAAAANPESEAVYLANFGTNAGNLANLQWTFSNGGSGAYSYGYVYSEGVLYTAYRQDY